MIYPTPPFWHIVNQKKVVAEIGGVRGMVDNKGTNYMNLFTPWGSEVRIY
jgi:hypothetical protein